MSVLSRLCRNASTSSLALGAPWSLYVAFKPVPKPGLVTFSPVS